MAQAKTTMTSLGSDNETCCACEKAIPRGSQMTAFEYDNGEAAGWHCESCVENYKRWGVFDPGRCAIESKARM